MMNITMLRMGTNAVSTNQPEYPALEMILTSQTRRNMETTAEITPKTTKTAVTLLGTETQSRFACVLHGRAEAPWTPANPSSAVEIASTGPAQHEGPGSAQPGA
jgi:hypothetical protein